jgi:hypothetical protein
VTVVFLTLILRKKTMTDQEILDKKYHFNDAGANSLREYFKNLAYMVWQEEEGFSGKRPFGNSGWQYDVYKCLKEFGIVSEEQMQRGYRELDEIVLRLIQAM